MGKNLDRNRYFDVAVPRYNTLLLDYLDEMYASTNIPESQVLVQLATEYVKQVKGQASAFVSAPGSMQAMLASLFSGVSQTGQSPPVSISGAPLPIQTITYDPGSAGAADEDMDLYGEPD